MQHKTHRISDTSPSPALCSGIKIQLVVLAGVALAGCDQSGASEPEGVVQPLTAECVSDDASLPPDAWTCPETLSVECGSGSANPQTLYVLDSVTACAGTELQVTPGPFAVGQHEILVSSGSDVVCRSELVVKDTQAPVLTPKTLNLWPPNHKFHSIAVGDCFDIADACQSDLQAEFIWASSDEPVDDLGDGHHAPDILIDDCQKVQLRAERQGPKDGRVYKLGVRVVDGSGNASEGVCTVVVDHDQRGVLGADSGEAYRINLNGQGGQLSCDGENELPPRNEPPVNQPPVNQPPVEQPPAVDAGGGAID